MSTTANYTQAAAAELEIGLGHLRASLNFWSPSIGLSPAEAAADSQVGAWHRFSELLDQLTTFAKEEGPGA